MLVTIDYLILNFEGTLTEKRNPILHEGVQIASTPQMFNNPFSTVKHQYGNKTYREVYDLFYNDEKIAVINSVPTSPVIKANLVQIQFENHLFYTKDLRGLGQLVFTITDYFDLKFDAINRLDIALDKNDYNDKYVTLYTELIQGEKKIKGREKNVAAYMVTKNGSTEFTGFTIGKRTSSRMLRIYNKTKALLLPKNPKQYINDYFQKNLLTDSVTNPVWRYEYQLNATFFTYLLSRGRNITYQIFDLDFLIELLEIAEKNHFEIVYDTGKTETNKELDFILNDWSQIRSHLNVIGEAIITKLKKIFEPSINCQKRLIKGLFRQYYIEPNLSFLYPLTKIINEYNLKDWFYDKYHFYIREFEDREKLKNWFNEPAFTDRYYTLTNI